MTHRWCSLRLQILLVAAVLASPALSSDFCTGLEGEYLGRTYVAKVPLYDTEIGTNAILELERDDEEIPAGGSFSVSEIHCRGKKITFELEPLEGAEDDVEIYFHMPQASSEFDDQRMKQFREMASLVFDDPADKGDSAEKTESTGAVDFLQELVDLKQQGFGDDVLIGYVNQANLSSPLSPESLTVLRESGLSERVILAVLQRAKQVGSQ